MNLNDCINRLPTVLRGRFSSSNNASWLQWAADGIAQIERVSVGPGNKRTAMGTQTASGFVPRPASLRQITNAWLDGEPVLTVRQKDDRGFPMEKGAVTWESHSVSVYASETGACGISFTSASLGGLPTPLEVDVLYIISNNKTARIVATSGSLPAGSDSLIGATLVVNGEQMTITGNTGPENGINPTGASTLTLKSTTQDVTNIPSQMLWWFPADTLTGSEVFANGELIEIAASAWDVPISTPYGWTNPLLFSCERAQPGRTWADSVSGTLVKSNLLVEGYRRLARPATLTDELDLPEGTEGLMAAYLRWAAEADQALSSPDTDKAEAIFATALKRYSIDQSRTDGATRPTAYQFTPALTGRRP